MGGIATVCSSSLSMVCLYHNLFTQSPWESCLLRLGWLGLSPLQACRKSTLHIHLMFSCTCDFIFVHKRLLLPEIYPETYSRHYLSSLISSTLHHTLHTPGTLNLHSSENCMLTVLFCLQAFSAWSTHFLTNSYPPIRKQVVRKAFHDNIPVWGFSLS